MRPYLILGLAALIAISGCNRTERQDAPSAMSIYDFSIELDGEPVSVYEALERKGLDMIANLLDSERYYYYVNLSEEELAALPEDIRTLLTASAERVIVRGEFVEGGFPVPSDKNPGEMPKEEAPRLELEIYRDGVEIGLLAFINELELSALRYMDAGTKEGLRATLMPDEIAQLSAAQKAVLGIERK